MILVDSNDHFEVLIEGAKFKITPLTYEQQKEILDCTSIEGGQIIEDRIKQMTLTVKYCVKGIEGVKGIDGKEYPFKWDNNQLSDKDIKTIVSNKSTERLFASINAVSRGETGDLKTAYGSEIGVNAKYLGKF